MVLSRMVLDLDDPDARRDLSDPYEMHATLMRLVDAGASKPLWRLEYRRGVRPPFVLVQTREEPEPAVLRREGRTYFSEFGSRPNVLLRNLAQGDQLNFRVRANPTVTRDGKRHGLLRLEEQLAWIERQMERAGALTMGVQVSDARRERVGRRRGGRSITVMGVTFDGVLEVREPEALRQAVIGGIGHARAFGFGLITLAQ